MIDYEFYDFAFSIRQQMSLLDLHDLSLVLWENGIHKNTLVQFNLEENCKPRPTRTRCRSSLRALQSLLALCRMASYFDEHDCKETDGYGPDESTLLRWARLLVNDARAFAASFDGIDFFSEEKKGPPASKDVVAKLPDEIVTDNEDSRCPICLVENIPGEKCKKLPCNHKFHPRCILPWLSRTNTCPVCRHELPTDDEDYEEFRREKARAKQREFERESLHSSMYT